MLRDRLIRPSGCRPVFEDTDSCPDRSSERPRWISGCPALNPGAGRRRLGASVSLLGCQQVGQGLMGLQGPRTEAASAEAEAQPGFCRSVHPLGESLSLWKRLCSPLHSRPRCPPSVPSPCPGLGPAPTALLSPPPPQVYKDISACPSPKPYLCHRLPRPAHGLRFCPFEDVLGVGHEEGFASLLVPGKGPLPAGRGGGLFRARRGPHGCRCPLQEPGSPTLTPWSATPSRAGSSARSGRSKPCWRR